MEGKLYALLQYLTYHFKTKWLIFIIGKSDDTFNGLP